jgi:hypothetical protein
MIAKIGRGQNLRGVLIYNHLKVEKQNAEILFTHKMVETPDGHYSVAELQRSFEPYLLANRKTEKAVLHISLNPDPKDDVSDEKFNAVAQQYMEKMGYGEQPYIVFKHTDIERTHIHIVSVCVDEQGIKISDSYERRRSMDICRELEQKHQLTCASKKESKQDQKAFNLVDYKSNDLKGQIASVVRYLPKKYKFQSFGEYNALLSLFNITAEQVKGELRGKPRQGLVYFALNENGEKASNPFKASLFGKSAGYIALQNHYTASGALLKDNNAIAFRKTIETIVRSAADETDFKKQLAEMGINVMVRRNETGRIYGITFIDHNSKSVWNGSRLGKEFSANVFNHWWNEGQKPEIITAEAPDIKSGKSTVSEILPTAKPHDLFDFLEHERPLYASIPDSIIEGLGGLLPEAQGADYQQQELAYRLKKKKKHRKQ